MGNQVIHQIQNQFPYHIIQQIIIQSGIQVSSTQQRHSKKVSQDQGNKEHKIRGKKRGRNHNKITRRSQR